jgi:hypothetical protein
MLRSSSEKARIQDFLANEECDEKFIPPHRPHFGGLWEATVKSMKYNMSRILGSNIATYEELSTVQAEIEACLNSRPLCTLSEYLSNQTYSSPAHYNFLTTRPNTFH